ncbi:MAG: HAD-IA family hydrolase [Micropruina sp.]|nr:HAD-IA family hydrolase [Micropruina sp.]
MPGLQLTQRVHAAPATIWGELADHPELLWGHNAPNLTVGTEYNAMTQYGTGGAGVIESADGQTVRFTWGEAAWEAPANFNLTVTDQGLTLTADGVPADLLELTEAHWARMLAAATDFLESENPELSTPVLAVLFDADGVLQMPRRNWLTAFERLGGPTFIAEAFAAELGCLTGKADLVPRLEALLEGRDATVQEVLDTWHDIEVDPQALAVVGRLREAGFLCCLATNQQSYRGTYMREVLGLDQHFDRVFYSYEVGHAKPSTSYFQHIVDELGLPAGQLVFVDDHPANVIGAREVGLRAALHRYRNGGAGLAAKLAALGASA